MLEKIKEKYNIDYSVNENINSTKVEKLLNQVYINKDLYLFEQIQKREDFKAAFMKMFDTNFNRNYDFLLQNYELFKASTDLMNKFAITVQAKDWASMLIENKDPRVKLFIMESNLLRLDTVFTQEQTNQLFKTLFSSSDRNLNLDLLMQIPSFEDKAKNGQPTALALLFEYQNLIMYPNEILAHLKEHNIGWGKSSPSKAVILFLDYFYKRDNSFNESTFNSVFTNILSFPDIEKEKNLIPFLKEQFARFKIENNVMDVALAKLEKELLQYSVIEEETLKKGNKIKL